MALMSIIPLVQKRETMYERAIVHSCGVNITIPQHCNCLSPWHTHTYTTTSRPNKRPFTNSYYYY